jgi:hypothetical protein
VGSASQVACGSPDKGCSFQMSGATLHIYIYIYMYTYMCFLVTCKYMYAYIYIYRDDDDAMTTAAAISACKKIVHRYHLPGALDL